MSVCDYIGENTSSAPFSPRPSPRRLRDYHSAAIIPSPNDTETTTPAGSPNATQIILDAAGTLDPPGVDSPPHYILRQSPGQINSSPLADDDTAQNPPRNSSRFPSNQRISPLVLSRDPTSQSKSVSTIALTVYIWHR